MQSPSRRLRVKNKMFTSETLEVVCRIKDYQGENACVFFENDTHVRIIPPLGISRHGEAAQAKLFRFGHVFDGCTEQSAIFDRCCMDLLEDLVQGQNALLFAYGVTGGGKTYTMTGNKENCGILPRAADVLFNSIPELATPCVFYPNYRNGFSIRSLEEALEVQKNLSNTEFSISDCIKEIKTTKTFLKNMVCTVFVSYIEIYNDQCFDLLDQSLTSDSRLNANKGLRVDTTGQVFVDHLTEIEVQSSNEVLSQFLKAQERRKMAKTMLNASSSRSHSIFNIKLVMCEKAPSTYIFQPSQPINNESKIIVSQLSIVDLAGSERAKRTQNQGDRLAEASKINQSLSCLRKCFDQLRENQRRGQTVVNVSYRDQKLTHLFKNFFEGSGRMRMIICVNPQPQDYEENLLVMSFAESAQTVEISKSKPKGPTIVLSDLTNLKNLKHKRAKIESWFREVNSNLEINEDLKREFFCNKTPIFELYGSSDANSINNLRKIYQERLVKQRAYSETMKLKTELFKNQLLERLCIADLDCKNSTELEEKNVELEKCLVSSNSKICQLQRELNACKHRLYIYENNTENNRKREEEIIFREQENLAALQKQRKTLLKVAELIETPIPSTPSVAELRSQFLKNNGGIIESQSTRQGRVQATGRPLKSRQGEGNVGTTVGSYGLKNEQGVNMGFINPRFRRSRSAGARVLNHQPINKIPTGTVFQPKYPKGTKHTKLLESIDLEKHDEYMTTKQVIDSKGNLLTDVVKGSIIPTAGGGLSVMFNDVETLYQHDVPSKCH